MRTSLLLLKFILQNLSPYYPHILSLTFVELIWALDCSLRPYLMKILLDSLEQQILTHDLLPLLLGRSFVSNTEYCSGFCL